MDAFVDFQVLRAGKHLAATGKRTRKRLLSGMHANVVHQFVLGLERPAFSRAVLPKARVVGHLGTADVFDGDVSDNFMQRSKYFVAGFPRRR